MIWLIYGKTGWIGNKVYNHIKMIYPNDEIYFGSSRLENLEDVKKEIDLIEPDRIINAAGITGRPNVDWCEFNKRETTRTNVIGTLSLADYCQKKNIHLTIYATGCIYEYDSEHPIDSGIGFLETDLPNFSGSFYSLSKGMVDTLLKIYDNVLVLRLRMPLSDEMGHPRNFITKITNYEKVVNVPNSMTNLDELIPISVDMSLKKIEGTFNFCNPGVISHNEILTLYKKYVDPDFTWNNFSLEDQAKILSAGRSNNELNCNKLLSYYPHIQNIKVSVENMFIGVTKKTCILP